MWILIALILMVIGFVVLFQNPVGWLFLGLWVAVSVVAYSQWEKRRLAKNNMALISMARELRRISDGFPPIENSFLSPRRGEFVFYERDQVALREYKSAGRATSGGYGGASYRVGKNLSISGGGIKATSKELPEESTTIDTGSAIFTNQRVIFVGGNHTREWDLSKLLGMEISENGFEVSAAVSGRQKTSALAGDCLGMITPGFAFALAAEIFQKGEKDASRLAMAVASDIEKEAATQR